MTTWHLIEHGAGAAAWNMAWDEAMLIHCARFEGPLLRFYAWSEPAATFGYFQPWEDIASWTALRPLVRRPTGGGLVPHENDWTYSLAFPPGHWWHKLRAEESYQLLHTWISAAFSARQVATELAPCCSKELPGRCFAGPEKFDLVHGGRKIAGAAQRRNKYGLLIQGSIQSAPEGVTRQAWQEAMIQTGGERLKGAAQTFAPDGEFLNTCRELAAAKYSREEYNRKK